MGVEELADAVGRDGLGQAIGYMSMASSVGTLAGPLLGGVLYEHDWLYGKSATYIHKSMTDTLKYRKSDQPIHFRASRWKMP
jgi:MFS family permease